MMVDRRRFLQLGMAGALLGKLPAALAGNDGVPTRLLGSTGARVSSVGLGGDFIVDAGREADSIKLVRSALDNGINFLDNCWDYQDGEAERRMGKALKDGYRRKAFLMTKIDSRTKRNAMRQIDESLRRLAVDHIDLLQIHEVIRPQDPVRIFADGGAFEALLAARQAGKIRFIGFSGHMDPNIHLDTLTTAARHGVRFDTVQMPLNLLDAHGNGFQRKVLPYLVEHRIGVLGMKPLARSWLVKGVRMPPVDCLHYAMNLPTSVVITGCDTMPILGQALQAARTFQPLAPQEVANLLQQTAAAARTGDFEIYRKPLYDSAIVHPHWFD